VWEKEEGGRTALEVSICVRRWGFADRQNAGDRQRLTMVLLAELRDALVESFFREYKRWENRFQSGLLDVFDTN